MKPEYILMDIKLLGLLILIYFVDYLSYKNKFKYKYVITFVAVIATFISAIAFAFSW